MEKRRVRKSSKSKRVVPEEVNDEIFIDELNEIEITSPS